MTCVSERIGRHAVERADAIAAVDARTALTYAELDRRATQLARTLVQRGVAIERIIGICLPPSVELAIAIVAVWRAGGAYVAIDPAWPVLRQLELLDDVRSDLVLVDASTAATFAATSHQAVHVADDGSTADAGVRLPRLEPASLAYVLFTSGSTGRPKGVMIEHRHLAAYVDAARERYAFPGAGQFLLTSTFAADLGHTPIFCALCAGGTLHLVPSAVATDADALATHMVTRQIDVMKIVPSHLMTLVSSASAPAMLMPRTHLIVGGEPLHHEVADAVRRLGPGVVTINEYGPTETTVGVLAGRATDSRQPDAQTVPAGHPLDGTAVVVMSERLEGVAAGVVGELFVGGATVGRGYWGDPQLTASRFLPDPLDEGGRLYRTGDTGRVLPDGSIEIVGRLDLQVKIRGFRVEPTEVEAALLRCTNVHGAAVDTERLDDGALRLVGYVAVSDNDLDRARRRILSEIEARLPAPMVPTTLIAVRDLPLTANGKVDREALRRLPRGPGQAYVEPETDAERGLASIWSKVLKVDRVGRHDSFFRLGGDSMLMIKVSALAARLGLQIDARLMFEHPTLFELARAAVRRSDPTEAGATTVASASR